MQPKSHWTAGVALFGCWIALGAGPAAWAQDAGGPPANSGIEDIVVTATRQAQSLQRVPIAVSALSTDALERSNVTNLQNIAALAPGVQIQPQFKPGDAVFQIRGQVQTDAAPTIDPSVGVYFDDVYIARSAGTLANLLDVARVEVLKGPQGTLFGKNTTGGAIRIISNQPTQDFEGYGKVGYESFDTYRLEGVVNLPLGETLAARVAAQYTDKNKGWATNKVTGDRPDKLETLSLRGTLLFTPTDTLKISIGGDYSKIQGGGMPGMLRYFIPQTGGVSALEAALESGLGFDAATGMQLMLGEASGEGTRTIGSDLRVSTSGSYTFDAATGQYTYTDPGRISPGTDVKTWGLLGNVTLELGGVTLKSITAYRKVNADYDYDVDGTRFHIIDSTQRVKSRQFSQELLLSGQAIGDRLDWTVGGLYFDEKPQSQDFVVSVASLVYPGRGTDTYAFARNKSWGLFAQGTFALTDALSVTAGARYSNDKRGFTATSFNTFADGASSCLYTAANGLALLPGFQTPCDIRQSATFKEWSYTGSINYQVGQDKLVYVRTSRGFRAGGFNPRINAPEVVGQFEPEIVNDYELGIKADWLNRTLRTNLALFYSKSKDVQQTVNGLSPTNGAAITVTENIGTRKVKGVELDMTMRPAPFLSFDAGVAYLHARSRNPAELDVNYVQLTPPWTVSLGVNLDAPLSDSVRGKLRFDLSYRDKMHDGAAFRDAAGGIVHIGYMRDITLLGARASLVHRDSGIELSVYGRNLTNQLYAARGYVIPSLGLGLGTLAEPRVLGVEVKVPFGGARD